MTKAELVKMLENVEDTAELEFVGTYHDRDGWLMDYVEKTIYKVQAKEG